MTRVDPQTGTLIANALKEKFGDRVEIRLGDASGPLGTWYEFQISGVTFYELDYFSGPSNGREGGTHYANEQRFDLLVDRAKKVEGAARESVTNAAAARFEPIPEAFHEYGCEQDHREFLEARLGEKPSEIQVAYFALIWTDEAEQVNYNNPDSLARQQFVK